jgi:hypothetical protein
MTKISEQAIGEAALEALASCPGGTATIGRLKELIPRYVKLSAEDQAPSVTRPGEQMWEQQVRNLVSHRTTEGNIIAEGLADYRPGRLTITDAGRLHVSHRNRR